MITQNFENLCQRIRHCTIIATINLKIDFFVILKFFDSLSIKCFQNIFRRVWVQTCCALFFLFVFVFFFKYTKLTTSSSRYFLSKIYFVTALDTSSIIDRWEYTYTNLIGCYVLLQTPDHYPRVATMRRPSQQWLQPRNHVFTLRRMEYKENRPSTTGVPYTRNTDYW